MSRLRSLVGSARPRRSWAGWAVALVVVLAFTVVARQSSDVAVAFDVDGTKPSGVKALRLLIERFDGEVVVGADPRGADAAVLFVDNLSEDESERVADWVRDGGTLVVTDSGSPFADLEPGGSDAFRQPKSLIPQCDSAFVRGVERIEPHARNDYGVFDDETPLVTACFPTSGGAFMVEGRLGSGKVIALGSGSVFTNGQLDKADNSVFAMNLLQPSTGTVMFLGTRDITTSGDDSLGELIPESVRAFTWQLLVAAALLMLWRSRRVGKPVSEPELVELPGSQLTVAVGNLLQNADQLDGAARMLRADLRRGIAELIGMKSDTDPNLLAAAVSERAGVDRTRLLAAIVDRPTSSSRELVELAQEIESLHREVANAR